MGAFRKLAVASAVGIVVPIVLGGVVRATGSGDACPDWPRCFGRWIPPADYQAILEYTHRLSAAVSGILLVALAVSLMKNQDLRRRRSLIFPAAVAIVLVVFQSYLGKLVVERALSPPLVTFHLATALLLAATLVVAAVNSCYAGRPEIVEDGTVGAGAGDSMESAPTSPPTLLAVLSATAVLAVVLVGAYMRAEGASLAFSDWPLMGGRLVPAMTGEPERLHFAHRALVLLGAIPILWLSVRATSAKPQVRGIVSFAHLAAALYVAQIAVGAATVLTHLSQWSRAVHVALAALTFMASVACAAVCLNEAKGTRLRPHLDREPAAA